MPAIHEVSLEAYAILGTASMPVSQLLRMGRGAVVELDTGLGDEIEMRINDQLVAKGEVVVVEDRIAIEITEIVKRESS
jgi:flagellar motor switch protein FliN/FliY